MRVLYIMWESMGVDDILDEFKRRDFEVDIYSVNLKMNLRSDQELSEKLVRQMAEKKYDMVFSFNYFPVVSIACNSCGVKYVAWVYDSPLVTLYSNTVKFPYNYIFIFDKAVFLELRKMGINTVYFLPMAAAVDRYDTYRMSEEERQVYEAPVSFVGSTYSENKHLFYKDLYRLDDRARGYVEGMVQAQKRIYGSFILEELLTPEMLKKLEEVSPRTRPADGFERSEWFYAHYFMAKQVTVLERQEVLEMLSEKYRVVLYTHKKTPSLPRVENRGKAGYKKEAYYIYNSSKINLNISLRSIVSGIPLRAFDIMGSAGFLMTNYQEDFLDFFVPGEDYAFYDSYEDLMTKTEYYLTHEKERREVARNGYEKVKKEHTYKERMEIILDVVFDRI